MIKKIFNPFRQIAGGYSLAIGILIILLTSVISFYSHIHFPDIISVKTCQELPLHYFIIQNLINWLVVSIILYLISIFFSKSKIRLIDMFGTQALARFPYLFASFIGFSNAMDAFGNYIFYQLLNQGEPVTLSTTAIIVAIALIIITLFLTIWLIILMFNAFKVSTNLKGAKLILIFIISLIISIVISSLLTNQLIQII